MTEQACPTCGRPLAVPGGACPHCAPATGPALPSGNDPALLGQVGGWSWGAFALSWIWAFAHRLPGWGAGILVLSIVSVVPLVGVLAAVACLALSIYLGVVGNRLAWTNRPYQGIEHFRATERVWAIWGIVLFVIGIVVGVIAAAGAVIATVTGISSSRMQGF